MHKASEGGHLQVVKLLLSQGVEVDSRDIVSAHTMYRIVSLSLYSQCVIVHQVCSTKILMFLLYGIIESM